MLNAKIPLVDVSVNDLLAFADSFSDALKEAQQNPAGALQLLDRRSAKRSASTRRRPVQFDLDNVGTPARPTTS